MPKGNSLPANPLFSVIVPCCDVAQYVRACLESVKRQTFADWECIAVVETSKDDTERIVREFAAGDGRCRVFAEPRSGSPAMPRNTGLDHANGEYVVFLDGDDMLADDALSCIAGRIRERPGAVGQSVFPAGHPPGHPPAGQVDLPRQQGRVQLRPQVPVIGYDLDEIPLGVIPVEAQQRLVIVLRVGQRVAGRISRGDLNHTHYLRQSIGSVPASFASASMKK